MYAKRFEELQCWQMARKSTRAVYGYTQVNQFKYDRRLSNQITGAAISIMNNIAEGFDARTSKEFILFLSYSRRSCSEVHNCLYIAQDQGYINETELRETYAQCAQVRKMIDGLIRHLKSRKTS
jgi:four helix bundle protein